MAEYGNIKFRNIAWKPSPLYQKFADREDIWHEEKEHTF